MSLFEMIALGLGGWVLVSFLIGGIWISIREYFIRKHIREDVKVLSNDDLIFETVQEFAGGY